MAPLTTGNGPAWSPDGRRIAFQREGSIYVIDATGANERLVKAGGLPTWSPDGSRIAYQSGVGSGGGIYVMNADGSGATLLISHEWASPGWGDYCACSPAWSPDGVAIAFVRANYEEGFSLYTMNADGTGSPTPVAGNGFSQDHPAWSPDGSRISFDSAGPDGDQIASVARSGGGYQVHATAGASGYVGDSTWAPDGRSLAFSRSSVRGTPTRIYVVTGDGSAGQLIPEAQSPANGAYWDREPAWSRVP